MRDPVSRPIEFKLIKGGLRFLERLRRSLGDRMIRLSCNVLIEMGILLLQETL